MLGEAKFKARPTTPRTTSLPVVREGRLPTVPSIHPEYYRNRDHRNKSGSRQR
jgi:hypothetical protein